MKLNNALMSKIAATAMALSMALPVGAAMAQDTPAPTPDSISTPVATAQKTGELVSTWSVQIDPHLPLPLILAFGGAYGLFCLYAAGNRFRGSWMRAAAGAAVVATLVNPELLQEQRQPLSTEVAIVVDRSVSQTLDGRDVTTTAAYDDLLRRLNAVDGVNVRTIEVGAPAGGQVPDGTNIFTDLAAGLTDVSPDRLGAVIMLTDGQVHDMRDQARAVIGDVPVHVLLSGNEAERDRRVVLEQAPTFGLIDQEQTIRFRVADDGANTGEQVRVDITADDGTLLATQMVTPGQSVEMNITLPHTGKNIIAVQAEALAGELTTANNRTAVEIKGIRDNMRVLLLTGAPNMGEREWRSLLKSDPDIDLVHFAALRPTNLQDRTPLNELSLIAFPMRELFEEKLSEFDLVIFDHYSADGTVPFDYLEMVATYVEGGGALMVVSGPDYAGSQSLYRTPLSRVLPAAPTGSVTTQPYTPAVNDNGTRHPVTRGLDGAENPLPTWGRWHRVVDTSVAADATTIMNGAADQPLL
ncbi:MAG: hypothetical protein KKA05_07190, partial [Alphaproteobacteria bacterium]|nr:hypothetical protein [Alphaproteobacteria bacterium]